MLFELLLQLNFIKHPLLVKVFNITLPRVCCEGSSTQSYNIHTATPSHCPPLQEDALHAYKCLWHIHQLYFTHPRPPHILVLHPSLAFLTAGSTHLGGPLYCSHIGHASNGLTVAIPLRTPYVREGREQGPHPVSNPGLRVLNMQLDRNAKEPGPLVRQSERILNRSDGSPSHIDSKQFRPPYWLPLY